MPRAAVQRCSAAQQATESATKHSQNRQQTRTAVAQIALPAHVAGALELGGARFLAFAHRLNRNLRARAMIAALIGHTHQICTRKAELESVPKRNEQTQHQNAGACREKQRKAEEARQRERHTSTNHSRTACLTSPRRRCN